MCLLTSLSSSTALYVSYYHPHFADGKREAQEVKSLAQGHTLLNGAFGILYDDCLVPEPFPPKGTIMHVALTTILNLWPGSNSVRSVSRAQVCILTGTLLGWPWCQLVDIPEACDLKVGPFVKL